jgi:insulysin
MIAQRFSAFLSAILVFALLMAGCASVPVSPSIPRVGELDTREYRYLELDNRMRVLLVSDPQTDKSAASLHVRAGSGDDPLARQGLAHFLEHMLFLGTERYPDPGEYQAFISAHGGSHNAYTSIDHTNYFFDIEPGSLIDGLDRFSQFFVAPLFNAEYVEREMNAVDSEYRLGLKDDSRREYDVLREIVRPEHPLGTLAVGNLETLGAEGIRDELLAFYDRFYSANLMTLVVLGREPLDELQAAVSARFAAVVDRDRQAMTVVPSMFAAGTLPLELHIRPLQEARELTLLFPIPSARSHFDAKPLEYIGNLLGHEGAGSLLSVLKARGWAESLSAGAGLDLYEEDAFQVSVQLSSEGVQHYREIAALVLHAITQLGDSGIEQWRFSEQGSLAELAFRFREKGSPTGTVIGLANALQDYPVEEALRGPYLYRSFDAALIARYLGYLRPDNLLLTLSHPGAETDRESRWFGTPYASHRLDTNGLQPPADLLASLALPAANEFIPRQVDLKPAEDAATELPELLDEQAGYRLWHLQDTVFRAPKASIHLQLLAPMANDSPRHAALSALHARLVSDALNEYAYPATLAGLQYSVTPSARGLSVRISGYDDAQMRLLGRILDALRMEAFSPDRFARLKAELMREWGNSSKQRPFLQLVDELRSTMIARNWSDAQLQAALAPQQESDLEAYLAAYRSDAALEVLVHGNFRRDEARRIGATINSAMRGELPGVPRAPSVDIVRLDDTRLARELPVDHPDSALLLYLQGNEDSYAERARVALAAQILSAPFFNELRTEKQLGYVVFAQSLPLHRVPGLVFAVQSPVSPPGELSAAVDVFLRGQVDALRQMSEADFARHRSALVERLREAPKSLGERSERLWSDIGLGVHGFDDREQVALQVMALDRGEWMDFFTRSIAGEGQRALVAYSVGSAHRESVAPTVPGKLLTPDAQWRGSAQYYRFDWVPKVQDPEAALHL